MEMNKANPNYSLTRSGRPSKISECQPDEARKAQCRTWVSQRPHPLSCTLTSLTLVQLPLTRPTASPSLAARECSFPAPVDADRRTQSSCCLNVREPAVSVVGVGLDTVEGPRQKNWRGCDEVRVPFYASLPCGLTARWPSASATADTSAGLTNFRTQRDPHIHSDLPLRQHARSFLHPSFKLLSVL